MTLLTKNTTKACLTFAQIILMITKTYGKILRVLKKKKTFSMDGWRVQLYLTRD